MHVLSVADVPDGDGVRLAAALVLAEEAGAAGANAGDFITSQWVPGLLACLRSALAIGVDALSLTDSISIIFVSVVAPPTRHFNIHFTIREWSVNKRTVEECELLHDFIAALLLPLLQFCAAPTRSAVDWGADWKKDRATPTTADLLDRLPRDKIPGVQQRLDACALAYMSCSVELAATASVDCGSDIAAATRGLVFPLLKSREAHLNALALLLIKRCVGSDTRINWNVGREADLTDSFLLLGWQWKCGRC